MAGPEPGSSGTWREPGIGEHAGAAVVVGAVVHLDFDTFYRSEAPRVLAAVTSLTGRRELAEELTQEAFATAHRRWAKISRYDQPGDWVKRVALNRAISSFRSRQAERRAFDRLRRLPVRTTTETSALDDELWLAVRSLPDRQAQAIALTYVADLPADRVAAILGCSEGTVKSHLHRGRQALARALAGPLPTATAATRPTDDADDEHEDAR